MKINAVRTLTGFCTIALTLLLLTASTAFAQRWDKRTTLTVGERIEVPGAILEPGNYVLKLVESDANRHIVRFMNEEENRVISTVLAIPNYRLKVTGDTQFAWYESPAGEPRALRAWFYPGDNFGQEFVYPKRRAERIAAVAHEPVPAVADIQEPVMRAAVEPEAPVAKELKEAEVAPSEPVELAQAPPPAQPAPAPRPTRLPDTAGLGGLFGLLGVLGLGSFAALRFISRRTL